MTIFQRVMDAESGRQRAPDIEGGKRIEKVYLIV